MVEVGFRTNQPRLRQLSVFVENRVGLLLRLTRTLELQGAHILGFSILEMADTAVVRMIVDNVSKAKEVFLDKNLTVYDADVVGVELPLSDGIGISSILGILLRGEINVHYLYPLLIQSHGNPVLAIHSDSIDIAMRLLQRHEMHLLDQDDLKYNDPCG
ncbi:MAG: hypothetical protein ACYTFT_07670 [Planctomycetota bacterium]|jgi:hypothetical protein